jgi:hypothetical protein
MAVSRSVTSSELDFTSAATTKQERICPLRINTSAIDSPYRKPEQDADKSTAMSGPAPRAR